jgi:integrase
MATDIILQKLPPVPRRELKRDKSIRDLWTIFVGLKGQLSEATIHEYKVIGLKFIDYVGSHGLTPMSMVKYPAFLKSSGIGNNTVNSELTRIRSFLKFLRTMRYIGEDLSEVVKSLPREPVKKHEIFTAEEYERIKDYCAPRQQFHPHLWLTILSYGTGMSLIDCCYLRWKDVHLDDNGPCYIDVHRAKNKRFGERAVCRIPVIPFGDIHTWLLNLKKVEHLNYKRFDGITDYVHQDCPGLYDSGMSLSSDFRNIFRRIGIGKEKKFKHFRSTFCSNLVNSGTHIALICKMTGHNNTATLLRYLVPDRAELEMGLQKAMEYAARSGLPSSEHSGFSIEPSNT